MNQPTVIYPLTHHFAGRHQTVRGGNWLVRHASQIDRIEVIRNEFKAPGRDHDVVITAYCCDGKFYTSDWNNLEVLWNWLQRPSLLGIRLMWCGQPLVITKGLKMP